MMPNEQKLGISDWLLDGFSKILHDAQRDIKIENM
jgi:hypothetical protein